MLWSIESGAEFPIPLSGDLIGTLEGTNPISCVISASQIKQIFEKIDSRGLTLDIEALPTGGFTTTVGGCRLTWHKINLVGMPEAERQILAQSVKKDDDVRLALVRAISQNTNRSIRNLQKCTSLLTVTRESRSLSFIGTFCEPRKVATAIRAADSLMFQLGEPARLEVQMDGSVVMENGDTTVLATVSELTGPDFRTEIDPFDSFNKELGSSQDMFLVTRPGVRSADKMSVAWDEYETVERFQMREPITTAAKLVAAVVANIDRILWRIPRGESARVRLSLAKTDWSDATLRMMILYGDSQVITVQTATAEVVDASKAVEL